MQNPIKWLSIFQNKIGVKFLILLLARVLFEEILSVKTNLPIISARKYCVNQLKFVSSMNCQKLEGCRNISISHWKYWIEE